MAKEDTKAKILYEGARLVHDKGFGSTGIQEILNAAGVPKGSFYFYFKSKEEFGLELIDFFMKFILNRMDTRFNDLTMSPLERLQTFFQDMEDYCTASGCKDGCPIGNMAQELGCLSDDFRAKVAHSFETMKFRIYHCLHDARKCGELDEALDPERLAEFILDGWEGALLRMKANRSIEPLVVFRKMVFKHLLGS
jgi:TetR/AcrR family transcriptional repressor of nem operon